MEKKCLKKLKHIKTLRTRQQHWLRKHLINLEGIDNMSDKLALWNRVEKTNPAHTKKAKIGGLNITSVDPQHQILAVTKEFGSYGMKWGFKNIELTYDLVEKFNMVVFKGTFFCPDGEFEIINSCKLYMDRALTMVDDNFAKKLETDALTKAISKLGFNADIFLGKFDDIRYVNELNNEFGNEPTSNTYQKNNKYDQGNNSQDISWLSNDNFMLAMSCGNATKIQATIKAYSTPEKRMKKEYKVALENQIKMLGN